MRGLVLTSACVLGLAAGGVPRPAQEALSADAARLVKALGVRDGQTVADIGAGGGQLTVALARIVGPSGRVYGTELNVDRVRAIDAAARAEDLKNVIALEGHATQTNLPADCCDALVVRFVYHHFKDPGRMNASLLRSLKPGGLIGVIDFRPSGTESPDPAQRASDDHHGVTSATVARELRDAGFDVVATDDRIRDASFLVVARRPAGRLPSPE